MLPSNIFHSLSCLPSLSIEYWSSEEKMIFENTLVYSLLCIPSIEWSYEEEKIFDNSLVEFGLNCPDLFQRIATRLPRKSVLQIKEHLGELVEDIEMITGSRKNPEIPIPTNKASETCGDRVAVAPAVTEKPRKKRGRGYEWTEEEHEYVSKTLVCTLIVFVIIGLYIISTLLNLLLSMFIFKFLLTPEKISKE